MTALDEADQMADMGFLPEVRTLLADTPNDSQRLLFSATLDNDVKTLVREFLPEHELHSTQDGRASVTTMDHYVLLVDRGDKDAVLAEIASREGGRTIMFARTKLGARASPSACVRRVSRRGPARRQSPEPAHPRARALQDGPHPGTRGHRRRGARHPRRRYRPRRACRSAAGSQGLPAPRRPHRPRGEAGVVAAIVLPNQRRMFRRLTGMAGVNATAVPVFPGSEELATITGAQAPSGEPVRDSYFRSERDSRGDRRERSFGDRGPRRDGGFRGNRDDRGPRRDFGDRGRAATATVVVSAAIATTADRVATSGTVAGVSAASATATTARSATATTAARAATSATGTTALPAATATVAVSAGTATTAGPS